LTSSVCVCVCLVGFYSVLVNRPVVVD
jgi:hypothetical protein